MDVRKRKRGIRASREKLEAAMISAGFETQTELAKQIAESEGINKPPKDLVSKVFREQAVSAHNLTRVAIALGVEAHAIYLTKEDSQFNETIAEQSGVVDSFSGAQSSSNQQEIELPNPTTYASEAKVTWMSVNNKGILLGLVATFAIVTIVVWQLYGSNNTSPPEPTANALQSPLGKVKILIQAPAEIKGIAQQINNKLVSKNNISATVTSSPHNYHLSTFEALDTWQVHAVLKLYLTKGKYYQLITASLSSLDRSEIVLQSTMRNSELAFDHKNMSNALLTATETFIAGEQIAPSMTTSSQALDYYLRAKNLLFISHSASNYQAVLDFLEIAMQLDPQFSQAFAEACRTSVRMSWIKEETTLLEKAANYCKVANSLQATSISTLTAQAELWSKTGNVEKAIDLLKPEIDVNTNNADFLVILANLYLMSEAHNNELDSSNLAEKYAQEAILLAPNHWQAYNILGNLYFAKGQMQDAKSQFLLASKVVKHEVILANLGTLQLCYGELENATQTYVDIIENFESNYIGYENLGSVYSFKQDSAQALKNKLIAVEKQPEVSIHQVWGGLAEAYLQNGEVDKAWQNYRKALTLIERDELLENGSLSEQLHKLYYQQKLNRLYPSKYTVDHFEKRLTNFIENRANLGIKERSHLAWLAGEANYIESKNQIWQEVTQTCKVYEKSPELLSQR